MKSKNHPPNCHKACPISANPVSLVQKWFVMNGFICWYICVDGEQLISVISLQMCSLFLQPVHTISATTTSCCTLRMTSCARCCFLFYDTNLLACRGDCFTWRGSTRGLGPLLHVWQYNHKKWHSRMHECDEDDNWISSLRQKVRQLDLWLQTFFIVMHLDVTVICTLYIYQN